LCLFAEVEIEENNKEKQIREKIVILISHSTSHADCLVVGSLQKNELENVYGMMMMMVEAKNIK
jgi:hypothetical protein